MIKIGTFNENMFKGNEDMKKWYMMDLDRISKHSTLRSQHSKRVGRKHRK